MSDSVELNETARFLIAAAHNRDRLVMGLAESGYAVRVVEERGELPYSVQYWVIVYE